MSLQRVIIDELIEWIKINLPNELTLSVLAKRAGYSKWHLQRLFYREMGTTLASFIREMRVQRAAYDLLHTQDRICDISFRYGFDSQQAFTRTFSSLLNCTPARYRKMNVVKQRAVYIPSQPSIS